MAFIVGSTLRYFQLKFVIYRHISFQLSTTFVANKDSFAEILDTVNDQKKALKV